MDEMGQMLKSMSDEQLRLLAADTAAELRERSRRVDLGEITPERMRDPKFAAQVRAEVESVLAEL